MSNSSIKQDCILEKGMLLKVDDVSISFGGLTAVDELSFDIK